MVKWIQVILGSNSDNPRPRLAGFFCLFISPGSKRRRSRQACLGEASQHKKIGALGQSRLQPIKTWAMLPIPIERA